MLQMKAWRAMGGLLPRRDRYQTKKGKIMLSKAMTLAQVKVAATNFKANVRNWAM